MPRECRIVILPFVAEDFAERPQKRIIVRLVPEKAIPVIMGDFVAEVPDQRPVTLANGISLPFALDVLSLGDVQRDDPLVVPGKHWRRRRRTQEIKREPFLRILFFA